MLVSVALVVALSKTNLERVIKLLAHIRVVPKPTTLCGVRHGDAGSLRTAPTLSLVLPMATALSRRQLSGEKPLRWFFFCSSVAQAPNGRVSRYDRRSTPCPRIPPNSQIRREIRRAFKTSSSQLFRRPVPVPTKPASHGRTPRRSGWEGETRKARLSL